MYLETKSYQSNKNHAERLMNIGEEELIAWRHMVTTIHRGEEIFYQLWHGWASHIINK